MTQPNFKTMKKVVTLLIGLMLTVSLAMALDKAEMKQIKDVKVEVQQSFAAITAVMHVELSTPTPQRIIFVVKLQNSNHSDTWINQRWTHSNSKYKQAGYGWEMFSPLRC